MSLRRSNLAVALAWPKQPGGRFGLAEATWRSLWLRRGNLAVALASPRQPGGRFGFAEATWRSLSGDRRQLGHRQRQPLRAMAAEVDLRARVVALPLERDDHALAELVVEHALADTQARTRRRR